MRALFRDFGYIEWEGFLLTDITRRAYITQNVINNSAYSFEYEIEGYEKPEDLAFDFYGDVKYVWLLFLMNEVVDPIYDWILPDDVLENFIEDKYGASRTDIKYYVSSTDQNKIVDNTLTPGAVPVTNEQYEIRINESKRKIKVIRQEFADQIFEEIRSLLV